MLSLLLINPLLSGTLLRTRRGETRQVWGFPAPQHHPPTPQGLRCPEQEGSSAMLPLLSQPLLLLPCDGHTGLGHPPNWCSPEARHHGERSQASSATTLPRLPRELFSL